jgi:uncharacterized membrane protein
MTRRTAGFVGAFLGITALVFTGYAVGAIPQVGPVAYTVAWGTFIGLFALVEGVAISNDMAEDTLSEHFRRWFHTRTKLGRSIWLWFSGGFVVWFVVPHIALGIA